MGRVARYKRIKAIDPFAKKIAGRGVAPKKNRKRQDNSHGLDTWGDDEWPENGDDGDGGDQPVSVEQQRLRDALTSMHRNKKERLRDFERRVDAVAAGEVARTAKSATKTAVKRRAFLQEKKMRGKGKGFDNDDIDDAARALADDAAAPSRPVKREEDFFRKDKVRFNEVAFEPPRLTAVARKTAGLDDAAKRRSSGLHLAAKLPAHSKLARPGMGPNAKSAKPPKVPPARQAMLEEERKRAVEAYRTMKRRKDLSVLSVATDGLEQ